MGVILVVRYTWQLTMLGGNDLLKRPPRSNLPEKRPKIPGVHCFLVRGPLSNLSVVSQKPR